jgi:signal transduction histidine kinase
MQMVMYAERVTLTRLTRPSLSERVRLVTMVVGVAVAAAAATNALQWPLWSISPPLAAVNTLLAAAHAAVAPLLLESSADPRRQPIPWAFGVAGVCRAGTWVSVWAPGSAALSLLGYLLNSTFWLLVMVTLLLWSRRRANRWERRFVTFAAVTLYGGNLLMAVADYHRAARITAAGLDLVLIALFMALVARRLGKARGLERKALRTAQLPALFSIPAALAGGLAGSAGLGSGRYLISTALGIALLAMPLTMVVAMARLAAERAEVADAVSGLAWPANPSRLQSAMRRALHDPTIEIGYWVAALDRFVDAEGRRVAEPSPDRFAIVCQDVHHLSDASDVLPERHGTDAMSGLPAPPGSAPPVPAPEPTPTPLSIPDNPYAAVAPLRSRVLAAEAVAQRSHAPLPTAAPIGATTQGGTGDGVKIETEGAFPAAARNAARGTTAEPDPFEFNRPIAILVGGAHHHERPDLVASAVQAAGPALALASLHAGLQAERRDLAAVHREVEESRWAERRRLEQNLHDGAQHRLAALTMRLGAASATVPLDSRAKDLVNEIQDEIREVLRELREVADGIHPSTLTEAGLGPALEAVAERFPVSVTITAPARRFPPVVEAVAYYSTTEVLTIVTRQLSAAEVRVEVSTRGGDLWVRMTGVGVDARADPPGRYLAPLGSAIRAIGGELLIPSPQGPGFTVAARIPCG